MLATLLSAATVGVEACLVQVEVDVSSGLPGLVMVGLPDASVKESRDRVRTAIRNAGFYLPPQRITVNLSPADVRKVGTSFDLPIALGVLAACGRLPRRAVMDAVVLGELSLDGTIHPTRGVLPAAVMTRRLGIPTMLVARENVAEAAVVGVGVCGVGSLPDAVAQLAGDAGVPPAASVDVREDQGCPASPGDFSEVRGQPVARRAAEVAAAGGHHLLLVGPPGSGKTMVARRLPGILPPLSFDEALDTTCVHSVAGLLPAGSGLIRDRPFRAPHHTASEVALVGGGSQPRPGEISLAHNGVLFLDELPEFDRRSLEALRQPLEEGVVRVARAARTATFPAQVMVVGAMNPCPCGYFGHPFRACTCPEPTRERYARRLSGPLLDRFDLVVEVPWQDPTAGWRDTAESSATIRDRVGLARQRQIARSSPDDAPLNTRLTARSLRRVVTLDRDSRSVLAAAVRRYALSGRSFDRVLKVARTIADLAGADTVAVEHVSEALQYRLVVGSG